MDEQVKSRLYYFAIPVMHGDEYLAVSPITRKAYHRMAIRTVYVAGPLTPISTTENHAAEYLRNMRNMVVAARRLLMAGFYPFVPAFDFLFFMIPPTDSTWEAGPVEISGSQIKDYSMEWLRRCDAVLFLPGWSKSVGSLAEYEEMKSLGIPGFYNIDDLLLEAPNAI